MTQKVLQKHMFPYILIWTKKNQDKPLTHFSSLSSSLRLSSTNTVGGENIKGQVFVMPQRTQSGGSAAAFFRVMFS